MLAHSERPVKPFTASKSADPVRQLIDFAAA